MIVQLLYMLCAAVGVLLSIPHGLVMVAATLAGLQLCRSLGLHYYTAMYLEHSFMRLLACWIPGVAAAVVVEFQFTKLRAFFKHIPDFRCGAAYIVSVNRPWSERNILCTLLPYNCVRPTPRNAAHRQRKTSGCGNSNVTMCSRERTVHCAS